MALAEGHADKVLEEGNCLSAADGRQAPETRAVSMMHVFLLGPSDEVCVNSFLLSSFLAFNLLTINQ